MNHTVQKRGDYLGSEKVAKKKFKAYPIGFFHIDIAEFQTAEGVLYLFVAIDRTSKFAFIELHSNLTPADAYFGRGQTILLE